MSKDLQHCIGKDYTLKARLNTKGYIQEAATTKLLEVKDRRVNVPMLVNTLNASVNLFQTIPQIIDLKQCLITIYTYSSYQTELQQQN